MAAVNPFTTSRLRVKYTGPFGSHVMTFHGGVGITADDLAGDALDVITQMLVMQYPSTVWESAEYSAPLATFSLPYVDWVPQGGAGGAAPTASSSPATFIQFGGRAIGTGVRVKLYLFEVDMPYRNDMRYNAGEDARVDSVITELNSASCDVATVDGQKPSWYTYANVGQNDYLTHKART